MASAASALREVLIDEYKARASYRKVIEAFGPVRPFVNVVEAEQTHVLLPLFELYGIPVPEDTWTTEPRAPESILEACRVAVEAERANVAMYDRLLSSTEATDVRAVLLRLQEVSGSSPASFRATCRARDWRGRRAAARGW
jgi:hypothetical protein